MVKSSREQKSNYVQGFFFIEKELRVSKGTSHKMTNWREKLNPKCRKFEEYRDWQTDKLRFLTLNETREKSECLRAA